MFEKKTCLGDICKRNPSPVPEHNRRGSPWPGKDSNPRYCRYSRSVKLILFYQHQDHAPKSKPMSLILCFTFLKAWVKTLFREWKNSAWYKLIMEEKYRTQRWYTWIRFNLCMNIGDYRYNNFSRNKELNRGGVC